MGEGAFSCESDEIPVDKGEIKASRVGDEYWFSREIFQPFHIIFHGGFRRLAVATAGIPGVLIPGPPVHGIRVPCCTRECFQVCRECTQQCFVCQIGGRGKTEHGVGAGDGAIRFDIGADVDFGFFHGFSGTRKKPDPITFGGKASCP